jgi:hypothetical protein
MPMPGTVYTHNMHTHAMRAHVMLTYAMHTLCMLKLCYENKEEKTVKTDKFFKATLSI